jgi:geranylgeranyl pyrophosphate synthase
MTLSCEAVGGKKEAPIGIGAALTLLVEAANIHDDIIDQTLVKNKRKTTFGKYGQNVTVLAGDFLLFQASQLLSNECNALLVNQSKTILDLTSESLAKISKSAAKEAQMQKRFDVLPQDYLEIVKLRASVPQVHCMIGGILGGGTDSMVDCLGLYGKNYGVVGTVIDEFMDLYDYTKFSNRLRDEVVPLPVLCALQDLNVKAEILFLIKNYEMNQTDHNRLVRSVLSSVKVKKVQKEIAVLPQRSIAEVQKTLRENNAQENLVTIQSMVKDLLCNIDDFTSLEL